MGPGEGKINLSKHGLSFALAPNVLLNPLAVVVYDRFENREHRYHAVAWAATKLLIAVHAYPDADDDDLVRIIGLREATPHERRRYEENDR